MCRYGPPVCIQIATGMLRPLKSLPSITVVTTPPVQGSVTTACVDLGETASLKCGVWEHNVGVSMQENDDEVFVVLKGRGRIIFNDGTTPDMLLAPGVVGRLLAGQGRRWEIDEDFRKVWIVTRDANCL